MVSFFQNIKKIIDDKFFKKIFIWKKSFAISGAEELFKKLLLVKKLNFITKVQRCQYLVN